MAESGVYIEQAAPLLISICVDKKEESDLQGRLYHYYSAGEHFGNFVQLLEKIEEAMDLLNYPQASVEIRSFIPKIEQQKQEVARVMEQEMLMEKSGAKGTFVVKVQCRQHATWQGYVLWVEKNERQYFRSALELVKLIDGALDDAEAALEEADE